MSRLARAGESIKMCRVTARTYVRARYTCLEGSPVVGTSILARNPVGVIVLLEPKLGPWRIQVETAMGPAAQMVESGLLWPAGLRGGGSGGCGLWGGWWYRLLL